MDEEQDEGAPSFLVPLVAQMTSSIRARAQGVVAEDAPPDEKILKSILGGLRSKTPAQREQALRLYQAARRALPSGTVSSNCCLAACLAILALKTLAEVRRLGLLEPSDWLKRYILLLEETKDIFAGQIGGGHPPAGPLPPGPRGSQLGQSDLRTRSFGATPPV